MEVTSIHKNQNLKNPLFFNFLMAQDRMSMPSAYGGIVRYFNEYSSKLNFKPGHVIFITLILILVVLFLHAVNPLGF